MELSLFLQLTINGFLIGGFYALATVGFSLAWNVIGLVNLAHGEFLLIGALLTWSLHNPEQFQGINLVILAAFGLAFGFILSDFLLRPVMSNIWNRRATGYVISAAICSVAYVLWSISGFPSISPWLTIAIVALILFGSGYALQSLMLNRLINGPYFTMLLVTFAIRAILEQISLLVYGANTRTIDLNSSFWRIGQSDITISQTRLYVMLISIAVILSLALFLRRARVGQAIRATMQHRLAARLVGIQIPRIYAITFGIALALTGAAGSMLSTFQPFTPTVGIIWTLRACAITVLSGLGPIENVLIGSIFLGLAETYVGGYIGTDWVMIVSLLLLLLLVILRPQYIFKPERA